VPKKIIYPELEAGLAGKGILKTEVCRLLKIMPRTLSNKFSGVSHFTVEEAIRIQEQWFNDIPIEKLFKKNEEESG
jgi:hypothetical protein